MNYKLITDLITPDNMVNIKYDFIKNVCKHIWLQLKSYLDFEDVFHYTILHCLEKLDRNKTYEQEYLKAYLFKAFRINMIRFYKYAYNRLLSNKDIAELDIVTSYNIDNIIDCSDMLEYIQCNYDLLTYNLLLDNLKGMTYKELDKSYNINSYYILSKIKNELKNYYKDYNDLYN